MTTEATDVQPPVMTTVYFIGGPAAGTSKEMPEPLSSVHHVQKEVSPPDFSSIAGARTGSLLNVMNYTYILYSVQRGKNIYRCYITNEKDLGGLDPADFAHVPEA